MRRSYGYTSGSDATSHDYYAHLSRLQRMPTIDPQYPNVHKAFNNKYTFDEEDEFQEEHQSKQHSPKSQKKVQGAEKIETIEDVQADGSITQKRKGLELCKWKTHKGH